MTFNFYALLITIICFMLGGIPFGYLIGRLNNIDIREKGSKNIGATNVSRVLGTYWGILTFLLDAAKGPLTLIGIHYFFPQLDSYLYVYLGVIIIIGNIYCPYLGFKGGKGVATSLGVFLYLFPISTIIAIIVWITVFLSTKISSVSSLSAVVIFALSNLFDIGAKYSIHDKVVVFFVSALILFRHKDNILRLIKGQEKGFKPN